MPTRISSGGKPVSRTEARNYLLINQLATPGLGSLLGKRYLDGLGQLLLACTGAGMVFVWSVTGIYDAYQQATADIPPRHLGWVGIFGALLFAAAWLWALATSLSLLRQARQNENEPPAL
jgi:hypothetical protein